MIPIYVINLDRSQDRLEVFREQFSKYGLSFIRIPAVDGKNEDLSKFNIDKEPFQRFWHNKISCCSYKHDLSTSEYACALSHLKVYQKMIDEEVEMAVICEDDIYPSSAKFSEILASVQDLERNTDFDILFIDHLDKIRSPFAKRISYKDVKIKKLGVGSLNWLFNRRKTCYLASCYILTNQGARKLLQKAYPVRMVADRLTGLLAYNKLNAWKVDPILVTHADFESTLKHHYEN